MDWSDCPVAGASPVLMLHEHWSCRIAARRIAAGPKKGAEVERAQAEVGAERRAGVL